MSSSQQKIVENNSRLNSNNNIGEEELVSNILVAIRVRPLSAKEIANGEMDIITIQDNLIIVRDPIELEYEEQKKKMLDILHRSKEQTYAFDKIFREHSQEEIFEQTCKSLVKPVLKGFNSCVFAYGPTGTGKTYTMLGTAEIPGINVLTIREFFEEIKKDQENEQEVFVSYVEIYNEAIRDLQVQSASYLELRDDPQKGVVISGLTEFKAESTEQIMNLLIQGNKRRTTEATNANQTSSRSHAVFQIVVNSKPRLKNTQFDTLQGKLSLIDLAGSERGTVTENRGIRLREGAKINRSLLALANCINALGDKSKKGFFVPYRDSKLTRMLKDSLGGNCKTVMIANISPAGSQFEETLNTLKYASRARNIKVKVIANKKIVNLHIAEYKNIITDLRSEIESLKSKLHTTNEQNVVPAINSIIEQQQQQQQQQDNSCPCFCGRKADEEEMKKVQAEIFENFQERIQLRRALMELDEQNALNLLEIKKQQTEIQLWRSQQQGIVDLGRSISQFPVGIQQNMKAIQTLKQSTEKNTLKKERMNIRLIENIEVAKRIREGIPKRIRHQDKKQFLELQIKNHILELQNIELEIHLQIQEKTINDLRIMAESQKKIIEQFNLSEDSGKVMWDDAGNGDQENDLDLDGFDEYDDIPADYDDDIDIDELEHISQSDIQPQFYPQPNGRGQSLKREKSDKIQQKYKQEENKENIINSPDASMDSSSNSKHVLIENSEQKNNLKPPLVNQAIRAPRKQERGREEKVGRMGSQIRAGSNRKYSSKERNNNLVNIYGSRKKEDKRK